ncbi:MAG: hypothetical protein Q4C96_09580 [Planctomycetia bacterium]|nr:hypothetical protein [Planctomycetia bacterium]
MKIKRRKFYRLQITFIWVILGTFLFSSVLPPIQFCLCANCHCPHHLSICLYPEKTTVQNSCCGHSCSCGKQKTRDSLSSRILPTKYPHHQKSVIFSHHKSHRCNCGCGYPPSISLNSSSESRHDKIKLPVIAMIHASDLQAFSSRIIPRINRPFLWISKLPVRLHLFLLVLLN